MNEFYIKTKKYEDVAVLLFKLLFLTVGFLQASSLTFGKPIISLVQWPTVALGCLIIGYRFLFFKNYVNTRGIILLVIFAAGYIASSLYTFEYGFYTNIRIFMFLVMQFGVLYAFDAKQNPATAKKHLTALGVYYVIGTAVLSAISFMFMAVGYNKIIFPEAGVDVPIYYHGFVHGRLFGAYWDPNIAATMTVISILISLYFITVNKKAVFRVLFVLNSALQIMYITFSDSRTGKIALLAGVFVFSLAAASKKLPLRSLFVKVTSVLAITAVCSAMTFVIPKFAKVAYNDITVAIAEQKKEEDKKPSTSVPDDQKQPEPEKEEDEPVNTIDRGYDKTEDISNRRFDIWKSAIDIFKASPIVGVSRANILPYVDKNMPDSYLVTNDHMRFDSMHNMFFEILASQGIIGIVSFVLFAAWAVLGILKNFKKLWAHREFDLFVLIIAVAAATCTSTLVMAEIVYVTSPISTLFWVGLGTINHYIKEK